MNCNLISVDEIYQPPLVILALDHSLNCRATDRRTWFM